MARVWSILMSSLALGAAACGSKAPAPDAAPPAPAPVSDVAAPAPTPAEDAAPTPAEDAAPAPAEDAAPAPAEHAAPLAEDAAPVKATYLLGRLALPSGVPLKLLVTQTGPTTATIDIPMQHAVGLGLTDVAISETELKFTLTPPGAPPEAASKFSATRAAGAEAYEGHLEAGGVKMAVRFWSVAGPEALVAKRPQTPVAPFPYKTEDVKIAVAGANLACTLSLPQGDAPAPAVVFLTGSGVQDRDETIFDHKPFLLLGDALARAGVASLRCDDRGAGGSTGDPQEVDASVFVADAEEMLRAIRARPDVKADAVGLLGHSEGGMTAAVVAKKAENKVAFVVTVSGPALTGREILVRQNADQILAQGVKKEAADALLKAVDAYFGAIADGKPKAELEATVKALSEVVVGALEGEGPKPTVEEISRNFSTLAETKWLRGFLVSTPAADLAASAAPLLALFGEKDTQVRAPENVAALQAACAQAKKANVDVVTVPGANHLYQDATTGELSEYDEIEQTMAPATIERIVTWVAEKAGAKR